MLEVVARFDGFVTVGGAPATETVEVVHKPDVPTEPYDFAKALQAVPKRAKSKRGTGSGGSKKTDYARKQERNSEIGQLGETFALEYERWRLREYPELAKKIVHVSLDDDTLGYDIESFETDGRPRYVEVKATEGPLATRFFISANEIACAEQHSGDYLILRVGNVRGRPVCCEIRDLGTELDFRAVTFECTFKPIAESPGSEGTDAAGSF